MLDEICWIYRESNQFFGLRKVCACLISYVKILKIYLYLLRCVEEKDKTVAMGFGLMLMSLFAFIPSPIFFGNLMDRNCLVWGKTCSGTGNCWLYNGETLR